VTNTEFFPTLAVSGEASVVNNIGIEAEFANRIVAASRPCSRSQEAVAPTRVPSVASRNPTRGGARGSDDSPAAALAGIRGVTSVENRQLAARTILLSFYDLDRSGYLDTAAELDAISCEVWMSLPVAFPNFAEEYGFLDASDVPGRQYRGSIVFNLSERLEEPAIRRFSACASGNAPPPTSADQVQGGGTVLMVPTSLREFLDTEAAARIAQASVRSEPGSASWAAAVRSVLVDRYDLDGSGAIDTGREVDEIPCVVWVTVQRTYGAVLSDLGLGGDGPYAADRIGIAVGQRARASETVSACAQ
jgi:hypothetical protein